MKIILLVATFVTGFTTSGCIVYERRTVPNPVVVQETIVSPAPRVITGLPVGYRTRVYRGVDYYYYITCITAGTRPAAMRSSRALGELGKAGFGVAAGTSSA